MKNDRQPNFREKKTDTKSETLEAAQPVLKRLSPKNKTNKHTNKLFGAFYNLDTIFCDEKEKGKKHVSHKY